MSLTIDAIFDGDVFRPTEPITLEPNTAVRLMIVETASSPRSFLEVAQSLALEGPPDWSLRLDEYLYGDSDVDGS